MSKQYTGTIGTYQNGFGGGGGGSGGSGTVTSVTIVDANGLSGVVTNPTTTPAITLSTTVNGIVKGDGTTLSAAVAADFPTLNQNTTGNAATATNVQNGSANAIVYQTASSATGFSKNTGGQAVLAQSNGGTPFWQPFGNNLPYDLAQYDQNSNLFSNNFINYLTTYTTNNGTKTFDLETSQTVEFIGTLNNSVVLPNATGGLGGAQAGLSYTIINNSIGIITIKDAANATLLTLSNNKSVTITLVTTGTIAGTWYYPSDANTNLVLDPIVKTAEFTAALNTLYLVDSTDIAFVVSVLATPTEGDQIGFISQNDTSVDEIQISNGRVELANINTKAQQYLVLTYINGGWVITTQTMVDNNGNLYTSALNNSATPASTQVVPWNYINYQLVQAVQVSARVINASSPSGDLQIVIEDGVLNVDASSGNITLTLPPSARTTYNYGQKTWQIRRLDNSTNTLTIQVFPASGDTILNGATSTTYVIEPAIGILVNVSLIFNSDGTAFNNIFYIN